MHSQIYQFQSMTSPTMLPIPSVLKPRFRNLKYHTAARRQKAGGRRLQGN
ncbi:MAG: hypothetical protein F6K14_17430 [Symploca sp. SIO2C1]|nr:hypothetical protein [Symploca sp. SIO2C1]